MVDGDVLVYSAALVNEEAVEVEPGYWTWYCHFDKVKDYIHGYLDNLLRQLKADDYVIALSDDTENFRKGISGDYKRNRSNQRRPLVHKPTKAYLLELGGIIYPRLEGDDVMGIISTTPSDREYVVVSIDKDMKTIPGLFYKGFEEGVVRISEEEADYNHLFQTLTGDIIDGYTGCPSIGKVTAKKILDEEPTWDAVVRTYKKKGLTEEYALEQARMARILRASDYDFDKQEPILWSPK